MKKNILIILLSVLIALMLIIIGLFFLGSDDSDDSDDSRQNHTAASNRVNDSDDDYSDDDDNSGSSGYQNNGKVIELTDKTFNTLVMDLQTDEYKCQVPCVVVFGAEWCQYCKKMEPSLKKLQKEFGNKIQIFHVDVDKCSQLADEFKVESLPALIYSDAEGNANYGSYCEESELRSNIKKYCLSSNGGGNGNNGRNGNDGYGDDSYGDDGYGDDGYSDDSDYDSNNSSSNYQNNGQIVELNDRNFSQLCMKGNNYVCPVPCVIDFGAEWCQYCKKLEPTLVKLQRKYGNRLQIFHCDVDESPNAAERFGAESLPTLIFVNSKGRQNKMEGFIPESDLIEMISEYCNVN